jgi:hypothetical protein
LDLFALHFLCGVDIMRAICTGHQDVDVELLSLLLALAVGSSMLPE